ncbi:GNAT family N-acetyltransferase [Streptomyces sp. MST-110588]|uniref:GNAT family N-acetyltransferase n=1 Tax=Streptomyces sp. MST-110588 TaxID=2833628 RepID=UPI001F5CFAB0|nr:GNAT family N-acetyltransferase [Streptomyces sp. MST-110588]UNO39361.1 GNAT family N-acetyltransferase [Streptomyces sp. MST-110588]
MTQDIRVIPEAHVDRALDLADLAFHEKTGDSTRKRHRDILLECERVGAYDGDVLVGQIAAHRLHMSVPGGELPTAGLDFVSVAPTHRRRGVLTAMMDELWRRCAAAGQPLACLWASEAAIYGRFGFGPATEACTVEIDSSRPLALRITPDDRPLRLVDPADAPALIGPVYEAGRARRAGQLARDEARWHNGTLFVPEDDDDDDGPVRVVVLGEAREAPAGYAVYRTKGEDEEAGVAGIPGRVSVDELEAVDAPAAAALWSYLASIDLTKRVRSWIRPCDDPLLHFAADRDQVRVTGRFPAQWLRLVDVRAALTARSWAAPVDLVLDVRDDALPANAGRFRLTAGPDGAAYEAVTAPGTAADLSLDVRELAACYLGGTPLRHLVTAGLVTEHTPGAVRRLDAALATEYEPFAGENY